MENAAKQLKLLYIPHGKEKQYQCHMVCDSFLKNFFGTNAILYLVFENIQEIIFYTNRYRGRSIGAGCQILCLAKNLPGFKLEELMAFIDYYVTDDMTKEFGYIEAAYVQQKKILPLKYMASVYTLTPELAQFRLSLSQSVATMFAQNSPAAYDFLMYDGAWGEAVALAHWVKPYKEIHRKKVAVICSDKKYAEFFAHIPVIDKVMQVSPFIRGYLAVYVNNVSYVVDLAYNNGVNTAQVMSPYCEVHGVSSSVRDDLLIPVDYKFVNNRFPIPAVAQEKAQKVFEELGLKEKKTLFVVADGVSFQLLKTYKSFWDKLIPAFQEKGFTVAVNGKEELFPGCKNVFLSMWEMAAFVGLCGHIVSPMTGIVDGACMLNTTDRIEWNLIFPDSYDPCWRTHFSGWNAAGLALLRDNGGDLSTLECRSALHRFYGEALCDNVHIDAHILDMQDNDKLADKILDNCLKADLT